MYIFTWVLLKFLIWKCTCYIYMIKAVRQWTPLAFYQQKMHSLGFVTQPNSYKRVLSVRLHDSATLNLASYVKDPFMWLKMTSYSVQSKPSEVSFWDKEEACGTYTITDREVIFFQCMDNWLLSRYIVSGDGGELCILNCTHSGDVVSKVKDWSFVVDYLAFLWQTTILEGIEENFFIVLIPLGSHTHEFFCSIIATFIKIYFLWEVKEHNSRFFFNSSLTASRSTNVMDHFKDPWSITKTHLLYVWIC